MDAGSDPLQTERLQTADRATLVLRRWPATVPERARLVFVHGVCEHGGRYARLARRLAAAGMAVHVADLRGHGESDGERIFIRRFDDFLDDLDLVLARARDAAGGRPVFLMGHSMGGAIAAWYALARPGGLAGLVLSAPAIRVAGRFYPLLRRIGGPVSRLFPRLRTVRVGARWLSRDAGVCAEFMADPRVFHGRFPLNTGVAILDAGWKITARMNQLASPLLILHGTADRITDPRGSRLLFEGAGSGDKTLRLYPGLYHDLFHEPENEQVAADVRDWLTARA